jgi:hypothetical protein
LYAKHGQKKPTHKKQTSWSLEHSVDLPRIQTSAGLAIIERNLDPSYEINSKIGELFKKMYLTFSFWFFIVNTVLRSRNLFYAAQ